MLFSEWSAKNTVTIKPFSDIFDSLSILKVLTAGSQNFRMKAALMLTQSYNDFRFYEYFIGNYKNIPRHLFYDVKKSIPI